MFSLSQEQLQQKKDIELRLKEQEELVNKALADYNSSITKLLEKLNAAIDKYTEVVEEAEQFRDEIYTEISDDIIQISGDEPVPEVKYAWLDAWGSYINSPELYDLPAQELELVDHPVSEDFAKLPTSCREMAARTSKRKSKRGHR